MMAPPTVGAWSGSTARTYTSPYAHVVWLFSSPVKLDHMPSRSTATSRSRPMPGGAVHLSMPACTYSVGAHGSPPM